MTQARTGQGGCKPAGGEGEQSSVAMASCLTFQSASHQEVTGHHLLWTERLEEMHSRDLKDNGGSKV